METIVNVFDTQTSLEHHGVKGQRWGIRRTPEQLGHKVKQAKKSIKSAASAIAKRHKEQVEKRRLRRAKKAAVRSEKAAQMAAKRETARREEILNSPSKLYKHRKEFSQKEIDDAIRRFQWEKNLRDLSKNEMSIGKMYLDTAIEYAESGIKAYNKAASIYNAFNPDSKELPIINAGGKKKQKQKQKSNDDDDD